MLWQRLLGRPVSESGTLCHEGGTHGRSDRCRRSFMLPILWCSRHPVPLWNDRRFGPRARFVASDFLGVSGYCVR
jgi:hypothetical protein